LPIKIYVDNETWTKLMETFNMKDYNYEEARKTFEFIKHIKELPKTAKGIYKNRTS